MARKASRPIIEYCSSDGDSQDNLAIDYASRELHRYDVAVWREHNHPIYVRS
jgi:hypothetical protein